MLCANYLQNKYDLNNIYMSLPDIVKCYIFKLLGFWFYLPPNRFKYKNSPHQSVDIPKHIFSAVKMLTNQSDLASSNMRSANKVIMLNICAKKF